MVVCFLTISVLVRAFVFIPYSTCTAWTGSMWCFRYLLIIHVHAFYKDDPSNPLSKTWLKAGYCCYCYYTVLTQLVTYHKRVSCYRVIMSLCKPMLPFWKQPCLFAESINTIIRVWPSSKKQTDINKTFREGTNPEILHKHKKKKKHEALSDNIRQQVANR